MQRRHVLAKPCRLGPRWRRRADAAELVLWQERVSARGSHEHAQDPLPVPATFRPMASAVLGWSLRGGSWIDGAASFDGLRMRGVEFAIRSRAAKRMQRPPRNGPHPERERSEQSKDAR